VNNVSITGVWVAVILSVALTGCNRPSTRTDSGTVEQPTGVPTVARTLPQRTSADEPLTVVIDPQRSTAEHDLTAVANDTSVTYAWSVNGRPIDGEFGRVLPKAMFRRSDVVAVEVTLNVQRARADTTVQNSLPRAIEVSLGRPLDTLHQGLDLTASPKGLDPDDDEIQWEYQWIRNDEVLAAETTAVLRGDRFERGDRITVQVTPFDREGQGEPYTPGAVTIPNGAPAFVSRPPAHTGGAEYVYQVQAADPEGDPIHYRLVTGPAGMAVDAESGTVRWPLRGAPAGRNQIEIEADDGFGGKASQPFELDIAFSEES
jgi:hypothetical protein